MKWWARISYGQAYSSFSETSRTYGQWIPTGQLLKVDAIDYVKEVYPGAGVIEWLQL